MQDVNTKIIEYIVDLKQKVGMSRSELSEITGIPVATLTRILNQTTGSPSFDNIFRIVKALGGSLDVMTGLRSADNEPLSTSQSVKVAYEEAKAHLTKLVDEKVRSIEYLKRSLRGEKIQKYVLFVLLVAFATWFILDVTNGGFGFIRY